MVHVCVCVRDREWGTQAVVCVEASPRLPLAGSMVTLGPESNVGQPEAPCMVSAQPRAVVTHQCSPIWCWTYTRSPPPHFLAVDVDLLAFASVFHLVCLHLCLNMSVSLPLKCMQNAWKLR